MSIINNIEFHSNFLLIDLIETENKKEWEKKRQEYIFEKNAVSGSTLPIWFGGGFQSFTSFKKHRKSPPPNEFGQQCMDYGIKNESTAIQAVNAIWDKKFEQCKESRIYEDAHQRIFIASPDAIDWINQELIEIKCPYRDRCSEPIETIISRFIHRLPMGKLDAFCQVLFYAILYDLGNTFYIANYLESTSDTETAGIVLSKFDLSKVDKPQFIGYMNGFADILKSNKTRGVGMTNRRIELKKIQEQAHVNTLTGLFNLNKKL